MAVMILTPNADLSPEDAHEIAQAYDLAYKWARRLGPGPSKPQECNRLAVMAMLNKAEQLGRVRIPTYLVPTSQEGE